MGLSSWFSSSTISDKADEPAPQAATATGLTMDFDTIVGRVVAMKDELAQAHELCEQANLQFAKYRVEIQELKQSFSAERSSNAVLKEMLSAERKHSAAIRDKANIDKQELKRQKVITTQMQARLNTEAASLNAMTKHAREIEQRYSEAQFDLEYLKCTTDAERALQSPSTDDKDSPLPPLPFVLVLVDGDAYSWSRDIFSTENRARGRDLIEPGGLAATKIKNEVTKYIMNQNGRIPFASKIITRVFCNYGGSEGRMLSKQRAKATAVGLRDFAVQFTERMPLFDFSDAGRGKERADDKIRENFHLFLSTPNCHAVFVAACTDAGFARMLEQYADHPIAYEKIVLVTPGFATLEIEKLQFKQTVWPNVFGVRALSKEEVLRREIILRKKRLAKSFAYKGLLGRTLGGGTSIDSRDLLMAVVPKGSAISVMSKFSQGGGARGSDFAAGPPARLAIMSADDDVD
ncbi:hypothetical protein EDD37DRAFT_630219 [Exophiala viscosa]|uniref:DUF7923 domain-containing protein n=1 Tax=Exophiala viscosa TaxID=2486360 RepID=A0AAN6E0V2_9EURO|nr:hypothetical protein EDD36DRAFT_170705 [Exophiala viscosa]KAI1624116.1 hypothetical protein EDD37DRAFT_630219 [Exophiala viscosa]